MRSICWCLVIGLFFPNICFAKKCYRYMAIGLITGINIEKLTANLQIYPATTKSLNIEIRGFFVEKFISYKNKPVKLTLEKTLSNQQIYEVINIELTQKRHPGKNEVHFRELESANCEAYYSQVSGT